MMNTQLLSVQPNVSVVEVGKRSAQDNSRNIQPKLTNLVAKFTVHRDLGCNCFSLNSIHNNPFK